MPPRRSNFSVVALTGLSLLLPLLLLLSSCGGGSSHPGVARLSPSAPTDTAAGAPTADGAESGGSAGSGAGPGSLEAAALAFANCMRANGVPKFPDPTNGGFLFHGGPGVDPSSPGFEAARAKCKKYLPAGPGSGPAPSAATLAHYLTVARCMRRNGVSEFPDPRNAAPSNPRAALGAGGGVISDIEGVVFVFPSGIDEQSPAFTHAAGVCAFPLHNH